MLPDWLSPTKIPDVIGPFRIVRLLGEGGAGAVFLAERMEQFTQRVAIKILHPQLLLEPVESSLHQEVQILAALDHPGIVRLLDTGQTSEGRHYRVMEYVDGEPLDVYCDTLCLTIRRRIEILLEILDTVEYAHRRLIIHSDLKPANMLITADGKASLLDFGVASMLSKQQAAGARPPGYSRNFASPEQVAGERLTVASDVYSMGAIAHSVLTGLPPNPVTSTSLHLQPAGTSTAQTASELTRMNPVLLKSVAECRKESPKQFLAAMRGDLEAILDKALRIHPEERFTTVQEMAEDLRRHLAGYPLQIRPAGWTTHAQKWVTRNKVFAGFAFALLLVIVLSLFGITAQTAQAAHKRAMAIERLHELAKLTDSLAGELYESVHGLPGSEAAQADLLQNAHAAMQKLTLEEFQDPQLDVEIAEEYEKLARIELNLSTKNARARRQAIDDMNEAIRILSLLPQNEPEFARARQRVPVIAALRDSAGAAPAP